MSKVVKNNLLKNLYPEIFELIHPTKNEGVDFNKIKIGRREKLYWNCANCPLIFYTTVSSKLKSIKTKSLQENPKNKCRHGKITQEQFLILAKIFHEDTFDYSETVYISKSERISVTCKGCLTKLCIKACDHLINGCAKCFHKNVALKQRKTLEQFIIDSKKFNGENAYNYDFVKYENAGTKVDLFCNGCKKHVFQTPSSNFKHSCKNCAYIKLGLLQRKTTEDFILKANTVHPPGLYDYSETVYESCTIKVKILCIRCEFYSFFTIPGNFLSGHGCPSCAIKNVKKRFTKTTEYFIEKSIKIYGEGRFDYSMSKYISSTSRIIVKCLICKTILNPIVKSHYTSLRGCLVCTMAECSFSFRKSNKRFIEEGISIYGKDVYDFSKIIYDGRLGKFTLGCKCGIFYEEIPQRFLAGEAGCPNCRKKRKSKGSDNCKNYLIENNIDFECETKIKPYNYRYDFTFEYNNKKICLEFDGIQHFEFVEFFHKTEEEFERRKLVDITKNEIAEKNGYLVIRISNHKFEHISNYLDSVLGNFEEDMVLYVDDELKYEYMLSTENIL